MMYADESRNEVLLNDEVRIKAHVRFKDGKKFNAGENVTQGDIEEILGLYPSEKNDPNAAHIMLVKLKNRWYFACDIIYDRMRVRKRFETAKQFLKMANYSMDQKLWGPMVDNMYSAAELAIQSILLLRHYPRFSTNQDHEQTRRLFTAYAENGNTDIRFAKHYDRLTELRSQGRYLNGVHNNAFRISESKAKELLALTAEIIDHVKKLLASVDVSRKPKAGEYIAIGKG
jgi:HEPN domain-containing protein